MLQAGAGPFVLYVGQKLADGFGGLCGAARGLLEMFVVAIVPGEVRGLDERSAKI